MKKFYTDLEEFQREDEQNNGSRPSRNPYVNETIIPQPPLNPQCEEYINSPSLMTKIRQNQGLIIQTNRIYGFGYGWVCLLYTSPSPRDA